MLVKTTKITRKTAISSNARNTISNNGNFFCCQRLRRQLRFCQIAIATVFAMAALKNQLTLNSTLQACLPNTGSGSTVFTTGVVATNHSAGHSHSSPPHEDEGENIFASVTYALPTKSNVDVALEKKYPFKLVKCAGKNNSVYMHDTKWMINWVCNNKGEKRVTSVMMHVFRSHIAAIAAGEDAAAAGGSMMMLDIGANSGFYGLLAGSFGLPTVLFDLQPECVAIIQNSIIKNNLQENLRVVPMGVSEEAETAQGETGGQNNGPNTIAVPATGCWGGYPFNSDSETAEGAKHVDVEMGVLSRYITNPTRKILMMKVDTEGNEKRVLKGAIDFFRNKQIKNAIVEVTPGQGFWEKAGISRDEVAETFQNIIDDCGYAMVSLADYRLFLDGDKATKYILGNEPPEQFDVWLLPSENLYSSLREYQREESLPFSFAS